MSWVATKYFLKTSWIWLKEHWQFPFLIVWTIIVVIMTRRNSDAIIEVLDAKKRSYKKQMDEIKRIHRNEILKRDRLLEEYEGIVKEIENKFKEKERKLQEEEKETIKRIIIDSKGDPHAVREEIEKKFNFNFID